MDPEVVVIGAGQAGLAASHELQRNGIPHVVLERARIGEAWRSERWDSFCLVTPNWTLRLPGMPYDGDDPNGFMPGREVVDYLERYAARFRLPVRLGVDVRSVIRGADGFRLDTSQGPITTRNVIVAAGAFPAAHLPEAATRVPGSIRQLHTNQYRSAASLPPGAVLVVGTGQSGAQIAEELVDAGRKVYLCVSRCGRAPRTYRGKDFVWWLEHLGRTSVPADKVADLPAARRACKPHLSGQRGGHPIFLRELAERGATLLGRLLDVREGRLLLGADLNANLAAADAWARKLIEDADAYVATNGLDFPADPRRSTLIGDGQHPALREPTELALGVEGITTVIWATGYRPRFPWIRVPEAFDANEEPVHQRGVSPVEGLYFLGLFWLHTHKSDALFGVGEDASYIADAVAGKMRVAV